MRCFCLICALGKHIINLPRRAFKTMRLNINAAAAAANLDTGLADNDARLVRMPMDNNRIGVQTDSGLYRFATLTGGAASSALVQEVRNAKTGVPVVVDNTGQVTRVKGTRVIKLGNLRDFRNQPLTLSRTVVEQDTGEVRRRKFNGITLTTISPVDDTTNVSSFGEAMLAEFTRAAGDGVEAFAALAAYLPVLYPQDYLVVEGNLEGITEEGITFMESLADLFGGEASEGEAAESEAEGQEGADENSAFAELDLATGVGA